MGKPRSPFALRGKNGDVKYRFMEPSRSLAHSSESQNRELSFPVVLSSRRLSTSAQDFSTRGMKKMRKIKTKTKTRGMGAEGKESAVYKRVVNIVILGKQKHTHPVVSIHQLQTKFKAGGTSPEGVEQDDCL
jgi:hypothetical protein